MVRTGARLRQTEGDIYRGVEIEQFQRDQSLIVVHRDDGVIEAKRGIAENGVGHGGAGESRGTGRPSLSATRALPTAILLVAKSRINGGFPVRGMPIAIGLVTSRGCRPPNGATMGMLITLTKCSEIRPAALACSAQWPIRPR